MNKKLIVIGSIILGVFLLYSFFAGRYNTMVELQTPVDGQWANVQSAYQRRADLIPNLVNTVKGYAEFEKSTLTDVICSFKQQQGTNEPIKRQQDSRVQMSP